MTQEIPFLQLDQDEAKEVVSELEYAVEAHRRWLKRFQTMLVCRRMPAKWDLREDSHLLCEFGRWYHKRANPYLKHHPSFGGVGKHHRKMHKQARRLAKSVSKNRRIAPTDYARFSDAVDAFKISLRAMFSQPREMLHYTDQLTGIANRYGMLPRLEQERERIRRTGEHSCIAMFDLDHFKHINDTYGHQAGDIVLQELADFIREHLRRYDHLYRYGGEEFLLLLPGTTQEQAKRIVDRLRRGQAKHPVNIGQDKVIQVTSSFGIAVLEPDEAIQITVERADQAMYAAKQAGRNRTRVWQG